MPNSKPRIDNVTVEVDIPGCGRPIQRGEHATIRLETRLNHGDLVEVIESCSFIVGKREVVAAVEYGIEGMRVGGRREIKAGPHLCYGAKGVTGKIPPNAVLRFTIDLLSRDLRKS